MACDYAQGLSAYQNKGKCGLPEKFDDEETVENKVKAMAEMIRNSNHVVFHTGAGISTAAGIPDFRGPKGVWTLEEKGEKPDLSLSFDATIPTVTHMALVAMQDARLIQYVVSQNVDGLHLKSGFPRTKLAELHGNMFIEECDKCRRQFVRNTCVTTVGQKCLEKPCPIPRNGGRTCRGKLFDNILDWESELPFDDLQEAEYHALQSDLNITLGTTLQILPSGKLPIINKPKGSKLIICNLQPTKYDKFADLKINSYVDNIMILLCKLLDVKIPEYSKHNDPTQQEKSRDEMLEWTLRKWQPAVKGKRKAHCEAYRKNKLKKLKQ